MLTRRLLLKTVIAGAAGASKLLARPLSFQELPPSGYNLVWSDEFNSNGAPNPENWNYERGFVRNEELQWYQPQNATCQGGMLIIESRRQQVANPRYQAGSKDWRLNRPHASYTSASLLTKGLHSWRYGYFVMRGRIDTRQGIWPAWWTLGVDKPWPAGGEIDIMEYYAGHINANIAWQNPNGSTHWVTTFKPLAEFHDTGWSSRFHIWAMEWTPDFIHLYLDGKLITQVNLSETRDALYGGFNPFHQPVYMLLNQAIGGHSGGDPAGTRFPSRFQVDYVRVYQRPS
jgi:beta-glucanase (GH16 family)